MIKIKLVSQELSGNLYITEKGIYIMDINFVKSKDTSDMDLYTLSWNDPDGEPNKALKSDKFVVVDEF